MIKNHNRKDGSFEMGFNAEVRFERALLAHGIKFAKATAHQDRVEHWDFNVGKFQGAPCKLEVKSMKRARRGDSQPTSDLVFVELFGISGYHGWIYGRANRIAFEQFEGFLCVDRELLLALTLELITDEWASRPTLYKKYRRNDRPLEQVTVLHYNDLLTLPNNLFLRA
jgi:hypothetical protein